MGETDNPFQASEAEFSGDSAQLGDPHTQETCKPCFRAGFSPHRKEQLVVFAASDEQFVGVSAQGSARREKAAGTGQSIEIDAGAHARRLEYML
jgi:hypothetical protein